MYRYHLRSNIIVQYRPASQMTIVTNLQLILTSCQESRATCNISPHPWDFFLVATDSTVWYTFIMLLAFHFVFHFLGALTLILSASQACTE